MFSNSLHNMPRMPGLIHSTPTSMHRTIMPSYPDFPPTLAFDSHDSYTPSLALSPMSSPLGNLSSSEYALVHVALAYRPGTALPIEYDAALDPSSAAAYGIDNPTFRLYLGQEALSIPIECLVLKCPTLGSPIIVRTGAIIDARSPYIDRTVHLPPMSPSPVGTPAVGQRLAPITVSNVFNAIYNTLHESLPPDSFAALDNPTQRLVLSAAQARCALRPEERDKGVKRIDVLSAAGIGTRVAGLSATKGSAQVWVLNFC